MPINARRARCLMLAAFGAIAVASAPAVPVRAQDPVVVIGERTELVVETDRGVFPFAVELADEPSERAQGLMYRRSMDADKGMLFDMDGNAPASFWMKNTYVSLDIIFIAEDGRVDSIGRATTPLSTDVVSSAGPVRFVLELVAGTADRIGLKPGDRIRHPVIDRWAGR